MSDDLYNITDEQRKLLGQASDAAIEGHVLKWINMIRKEQLTCGPVSKMQKGHQGEERICPIALTILTYSPVKDVEVHGNLAYLVRTEHQRIQVDLPFFVEYFIQEFDAGNRFQHLLVPQMVETPA